VRRALNNRETTCLARVTEVAPADWLGWLASAVLLATLGRQVLVQWNERSTSGLSSWLFVGQVAASIGFIAYSWLLGNWVFVVTNTAILVTAVVGQWVYRRNLRLEHQATVFVSRTELRSTRRHPRWLRKVIH